MSSISLLETKLNPPVIVSGVICRTEIFAKIMRGFRENRKLVLVSAGAGFGKTTCISDFIASDNSCLYSWLTLDSYDDEPRCFLQYLIASLRKKIPGFGSELVSVLDSGVLPPVDLSCSILINGIHGINKETGLVLDDFHFISSDYVHKLMERLVSNIPVSFRLIIVTREDPHLQLARLRAHRKITEIRTDDLRFSSGEMDKYLRISVSGKISSEYLRVLKDRTEGWICALQLASLILVSDDNDYASGFLDGNHYFFINYLKEQVFSRLDEKSRLFLLSISLLDEFCIPLCNSVTGRADSAEMIENFLKSNLFLFALDNSRSWFRFHNIFLNFLRNTAADCPEIDKKAVYHKAGLWFADTDKSAESVNRAAGYFESAGRADELVELLGSCALDLVFSDQAAVLEYWYGKIPEKEKSSTSLHLGMAFLYILRGNAEQATVYAARTEALASADDEIVKANIAVIKSFIALQKGIGYEECGIADYIKEIIPDSQRALKSIACYSLAFYLRIKGNYLSAEKTLYRAIDYGRRAEGPVAGMMAAAGISSMYLEHGRIREALDVVLPFKRDIEKRGRLPAFSMMIYGALGEIYYQLYELDNAKENMEKALKLALLGQYGNGAAGCNLLLSRIAAAEGDLKSAHACLMEAERSLPFKNAGFLHNELTAWKAELEMRTGRSSAAESILKEKGFVFGKNPDYPECDAVMDYSTARLYNCFLKLILMQAGRRLNGLSRGIKLSHKIISSTEQGKCVPVVIESLILRFRMKQILSSAGNSQNNKEDLLEAVKLGAQGRCLAPFMEQKSFLHFSFDTLEMIPGIESTEKDFALKIATAFENLEKKESSQELTEPLSAREVELLTLLSEGLTYEETASRMFISVNTVRFHIKSIYGKLMVRNRTKAVNRAKELKLI